MTTTPRLGAPELANAQYAPETTVNEQIRYVEQFASRGVVKDRDLATPPGSPAEGDAYLVAASPTGAWTGKAGKIAFCVGGGWNFVAPFEGMRLYVCDEDVEILYNGATWNLVPSSAPTESIIIACSDETTALTAATSKVTFRMPYAFTVTAVYASLTTAQATNGAGGIFTVDINEAGVSILSTKLTIDNTEDDSSTATTPAVISDASLAARAKMTVDIDQIGDGAAAGLKVTLVGHQ